jgi:hypothetical protein
MKARVKPFTVEVRRRRGLKRRADVRVAFKDLLRKPEDAFTQAKPAS